MVNGRKTSGKRFKQPNKVIILSLIAVVALISGGWTWTQLTYFHIMESKPIDTWSPKVTQGYRHLNLMFHSGDKNSSYHGKKYSLIVQSDEQISKFNESLMFSTSSTKLKTGPEVRHIGFVKVHKAASSTMQNMFFRFGLKRNLTFVFTRHPNYFSRSPDMHIPLVTPRFRNGYDILCNHGVFNYNIYSSLLPNDTVYLGIVRDPLAVFISAVNYYSQKAQRLDYISRVPGNKLVNLIRSPMKYDRLFFSYTKNVMARDFGFPETYENSRIQAKMNELDTIFRLVLIVEYFEESLVLMKRYLNWQLRDILFLSNNVFGRGYSIRDLSAADIEKFKVRNKLDYELYNHFSERFWKQFKAEPADIRLEVDNFKEVLGTLKDFCRSSAKQHDILYVPMTEWNEEFYLNREDCGYMAKDELSFIRILRRKQGSF